MGRAGFASDPEEEREEEPEGEEVKGHGEEDRRCRGAEVVDDGMGGIDERADEGEQGEGRDAQREAGRVGDGLHAGDDCAEPEVVSS